jgi:hypothetical protein
MNVHLLKIISEYILFSKIYEDELLQKTYMINYIFNNKSKYITPRRIILFENHWIAVCI